MPINSLRGSGGLHNVGTSPDVEAGRGSPAPGNRPGGVDGARPCANNANSGRSHGPFRAITKFFTQMFGRSSNSNEQISPPKAYVKDVKVMTENRLLLQGIMRDEHPEYIQILEEGLKDALKELDGVPGWKPEQNMYFVKMKALAGMQMNAPKDSNYTPEVLKSDFTKQVKIEVAKGGISELVVQGMKKYGAPCDEGGVASLANKGDTQLMIKELGVSNNEEIKEIVKNVSQNLIQKGISQHNYSEAKAEALNQAKNILKSVGVSDEGLKNNTALKLVGEELDHKALTLEEKLTEKNENHRMPAIAKHQYEKEFKPVIEGLSIRVGSPSSEI